MRLPWQKVEWLDYGTMSIRPEAVDCVCETNNDDLPMEVALRCGIVLRLCPATAAKWARWVARSGRHLLIAPWKDIPSHPNHKKIKVFISDNPANSALK